MLASVTVIRNAVIHLMNEQPLLADLPAMPSPGDVALLCTNLRTKNQQRPIFVDDSAGTFVIPYAQIRFVEIPPTEPAATGTVPALPAVAAEPEEEIQLDEDLLRRVREL